MTLFFAVGDGILPWVCIWHFRRWIFYKCSWSSCW